MTFITTVIVALGTDTEGLLKGLETWKLADEWWPSKLLHYSERPEYWEETWWLKETGRHSNSSEKPSANTDVKNSQGENNDEE